jgi:hypothetical protein
MFFARPIEEIELSYHDLNRIDQDDDLSKANDGDRTISRKCAWFYALRYNLCERCNF